MQKGKDKAKLAKTTVMLPESLLREAQAVTGTGITQTLRIALELLAARKSYNRLLALKGTYRFSLDLKKLREDR